MIPYIPDKEARHAAIIEDTIRILRRATYEQANMIWLHALSVTRERDTGKKRRRNSDTPAQE